jgi:hypothetical protein
MRIRRLRHRLFALTGLVALAAGLAAVPAIRAVLLWPPPSSRITEENFARIESGMSLDEIVALLGPPGDYTTAPVILDDSRWLGQLGEVAGPETCESWMTDQMDISVYFDRTGRPTLKCLRPVHKCDQTALEGLTFRAEKLWRAWFPNRSRPRVG